MQWASLIRSIFLSVKKYDILVTKTSGQSNLTTGCIATAHERFSGIHQVAPVCTPPNNAFLGPPESKSQTASGSVQPFLQGSLLSQTDRPSDHTTRSVMTDRIFVGSTAKWPNNEVLKCLNNGHTKNISSFHKLTCCQKPFADVLSHKFQNQKRKSTVLCFVK